MVLSEKGILKEFELVVYPVPIVVAIGNVDKEVNNEYIPLDEHYDTIGKPGEGYGATTYHVKDRESQRFCLLVWFPDLESCRGSFMCHEAGHTALEIFRYVEARVDFDNQEPFCYLLGSIFRLINGAFHEYQEYLEKKKKPKSKKR